MNFVTAERCAFLSTEIHNIKCLFCNCELQNKKIPK